MLCNCSMVQNSSVLLCLCIHCESSSCPARWCIAGREGGGGEDRNLVDSSRLNYAPVSGQVENLGGLLLTTVLPAPHTQGMRGGGEEMYHFDEFRGWHIFHTLLSYGKDCLQLHVDAVWQFIRIS